ncbi:CDP-glucose 4,6-dehydratase [Cohnella endophytica]|uniref:CDP-glucose 4,6-dehydratase n=1 Tax=Cohnella endophytica TaxID=2419778 RepID=A0A494X9N5_9BACL|nr:CDP-glucose 4,6-dehydratase [Cohnella endophytica]RKP47238.1 CDP-glucose 4,6-dehydratase [Cohnella endophytica]
MSLDQFWYGKKVLITGHTGFKGSWLSLWLHMLGAKVCGYALPPTGELSLYRIAQVGNHMNSFYGDVADFQKVTQTIESFKPEIVIHMAAQPLVLSSYQQPIETFQSNVMGTVHVLEASRHCDSVKVVLNVTSDKCYDNQGAKSEGFSENDPMGGYDPYSSSKGCSELVTNSYRNSFFIPSDKLLASARAGNVIGGGDWAENRIMPDYVRALLEGKDMIIRNPNAIRPWQYVLDPLNGYLALAERMWELGASYATGWNFGPDPESIVTVKDLIKLAVKGWPNQVKYIEGDDKAVHEAPLLTLNSSKARVKLGWTPKLRIEETVDWTIQWYRAFAAGMDMHDFTKQQIQNFIVAKGV